MKIEFKLDPERLTLDDFLAIEDAQEGKRPYHMLRDIMSKCMVGADGEFLDAETAARDLGKLNLLQFNQATDSFMQFCREVQKSAVPPAKGGSSS
jgi:hypothetical protein